MNALHMAESAVLVAKRTTTAAVRYAATAGKVANKEDHHREEEDKPEVEEEVKARAKGKPTTKTSTKLDLLSHHPKQCSERKATTT